MRLTEWAAILYSILAIEDQPSKIQDRRRLTKHASCVKASYT